MAIDLLKKLNGNQYGIFHQWIESLHRGPRIAWYPSAGGDFRDLLFLHSQLHHDGEPAVPDLFLHTDYWMPSEWDLSVGKVLLADGRTTISVADVEELPRLDLPLDPRLVDFPQGTAGTGRVLFMRLLVKSALLGTFERPVLYAFVENAALVRRIAWPAGAVFSHLIHVRYGGGCGGSRTAGEWLRHTLTPLGVELLISDGRSNICPADDLIREFYPDIWRPIPALRHVRTVKGESWSNHGDVQWFIVGRG